MNNSSVAQRHRPKFGYTIFGTQFETKGYRNFFDKIIACSDKNEIDTLAREFFNGSSLFSEMPDLSKKRAQIPEDSWESALRDFEHKIKQTPCAAFNGPQWKTLSAIACMFGLHSAGYAFRCKAIEYLYDKGTDNPQMHEVCDLFTVAVELGDFETAKYILYKRLKSRSKLYRKLFWETEHAELCYNLLRGGNSRLDYTKKHYTNEDKAFAGYIKGKRVAVVGPAPSKEESGSEIDAYDIIVRVTYMGQEHINAKSAGSRTDVSYYSSRSFRKLTEMENKEFVYDLGFVVHKNKKNRLNIAGVNERTSIFRGWTFFGSKFTMIPLAILDLLAFDIGELKIFNTNFYLDYARYAEGYVYADINENARCGIVEEAVLHDQIAQISLIRNLWKSNMCKADKTLERILSMSNEDVMNEYNKYFPYVWA